MKNRYFFIQLVFSYDLYIKSYLRLKFLDFLLFSLNPGFCHFGWISRRNVSRGGVHVLDTFSEIFFQKFHFWGTMGSYDARKISTESLEVSLQDSNIILNFWDDFRFLWPPASTDLTSKTTILGPWELPYSVKNDLTMKKCRFFKVYDTFTIM